MRLPESRHASWPDSVQAEVTFAGIGQKAEHYALEAVPLGFLAGADRVRLYWHEPLVSGGRLVRMVGPVEVIGREDVGKDGLEQAMEDILSGVVDEDEGGPIGFSGFL